MPYGIASPDGPKSGCNRVLPAFMLAIHAALRAFTGSPDTSACHTLSEGRTGHPPAPGTELAPALTGKSISDAAAVRQPMTRGTVWERTTTLGVVLAAQNLEHG